MSSNRTVTWGGFARWSIEMRVSVLKNFRTGGGLVSVFAGIKNLTVAKFPQQDSAEASFQQTRTNLCSTSAASGSLFRSL
jgi:hypothetical protein